MPYIRRYLFVNTDSGSTMMLTVVLPTLRLERPNGLLERVVSAEGLGKGFGLSVVEVMLAVWLPWQTQETGHSVSLTDVN